MAKIVIRGKEYDLWLGLWAMEQIEERYGSMEEGLKKFIKEKKISEIKFFFVTLANCGQKREKLPADLTEDILDTANLADLEAIAAAMRDTLDEARRTETVGGGPADDEGEDALAAEYDAKNG